MGSVCIHVADGWRAWRSNLELQPQDESSGALASPTAEHVPLGSGVSCVPQRKRLQA